MAKSNKGCVIRLNTYLNNVKDELAKNYKKRGSAVENEIVSHVNTLMGKNKPTTIKVLCELTGKRPQHVHQVVKKSLLLTKIKVNGWTLIVPRDTGEEVEIVSK